MENIFVMENLMETNDDSYSDLDPRQSDIESGNDSSYLSSIFKTDLESDISILQIESESECEIFSWNKYKNSY